MKILVVLPRFPYPLEKGDKLRAFHQIEYLAKHNDVYLFCISHTQVTQDEIEHLKPFCKDIRIVRPCRLISYKNVIRNFFYSKSLQLGYWDSKSARSGFKSFVREVNPDVIYSQMVRTMPIVGRSEVPKVMDFQDALSMNVERRMDACGWGPKHWVLHLEFKMLRSTEYNAFHIFDDLCIISEIDSDAIPHQRNMDIKVIPNGVDFDYYQPRQTEKKYDLVFCGNMHYSPNVDAAKYLVGKVMPIVWERFPEARLLIAGTSPVKSVRRLNSDRVTVTGWVNDIRDCYAQAKVFAAPMNLGSGLQNKLLEAMAMQIPCVTTSIANDSLGATPEENVLIGEDSKTFAQQVIRLLEDNALRERLALAGSQFVHERYNWDRFGSQLEDILLAASKLPHRVKNIHPKDIRLK